MFKSKLLYTVSVVINNQEIMWLLPALEVALKVSELREMGLNPVIIPPLDKETLDRMIEFNQST